MQALALLSALATIAAGIWIGLRLLGLARSTGQAPERLVGLGLTVFAGVAYPVLLLMAMGVGRGAVGTTLALTLVSSGGYFVCLVCLAEFTRRVFRGGAGWAIGLVAALGSVLLVGVGFNVLSVLRGHALAASELSPEGRLAGVLMALSFAGVFAWASVESLVYRGNMRKRQALGLADPVLVNRFSLWGLGTGAAALIDVAITACTLAGMSSARDALPTLLQSGSGLVNVLTWWLTFAPPQGYVEWVRTRSGTG